MESPASTQSVVTRCERCASYAAITRETPTYSFPSAADQSAPSVSTASFSASGRPPRCHSPSTRTCFAMPVGSSSPTMATTRGPCSTTSGTGTFSTPSGTPKWRPTGSKTFGGDDDDGGRQVLAACLVFCHPQLAARHSATEPPHREVTSRNRWYLAFPRLALLAFGWACRPGNVIVPGKRSIIRVAPWLIFYTSLAATERTSSASAGKSLRNLMLRHCLEPLLAE